MGRKSPEEIAKLVARQKQKAKDLAYRVTGKGKPQSLVISEPDIDAALAHLHSLGQNPMPERWHREYLINRLQEALQGGVEPGHYLSVAPGVFAIVKPFGVDLLGLNDDRKQVWLLVRPNGTDPNRITELSN